MAAVEYDVIAIGDFRFPGGTSSGAAEQITAQAKAGYRTGLIQVKAPVLRYPHPVNPRIRECLNCGYAELLDPGCPVRARLALVFHPQVFTYLPNRPLRVEAEQRVLVVCHPFVDAEGAPYYDWAEIDRNARQALGGDVRWGPVGPQVRAPVKGLAAPPQLLEQDWLEVVDTDAWVSETRRPLGNRPVIGRHSRPDPLKWPDDPQTMLAAYPADPRFLVRVMGGGPFLKEILGALPANWDLLAFNAIPAKSFLETIDFFVYFHHRSWVEAFGRVIAEAMAAGVLPVLPRHFETLCAEGAVYTEAEDVAETVLALHGNAATYRRHAAYAREVVQARFSHEAHVRRLRDLIGAPAGGKHAGRSAPKVPRPATKSSKRVVFMTSNGVGMGHLTRMLAIARRCDPGVTPVFVTMSQAMRVVEEYGFLAEFLPFHKYLGADQTLWNHYLRHELNEILGFYRASTLVFDGNVAYGGLVGALKDNPGCLGVWCRRGMWRPGASGEDNISREAAFHAVLEPGDLAGEHDDGLTRRHRERTRDLAPVRLLDVEEMLPRPAARAELGLPDDCTAVLMQLGSGNNYDYEEIRALALDSLLSVDGTRVVAAEWMIADAPPVLPAGVDRLSTFPIARLLNAFDFTISACGYNSFHEHIAAGLPSIFVPNENPMMDEQIVRAMSAESRGMGLCVSSRDIYSLNSAISQMFDPDFRRTIRERCLEAPRENGAAEAARFISELAYTVRADRRPRDFWTPA